MKSRHLLKLLLIVFCASLIHISLLLDALFFSDRFRSSQESSVLSMRKYERHVEKRISASDSGLFEPGLIDLLPHLASVDPSSLEPMFLTERNETQRKIAFCIPVVERDTTYILATLNGLFTNLEEEFKEDVVFIVIFAYEDLKKKSFKDQVEELMAEFPSEIQTGLLELAAIPPDWYDLELDSVEPTFNDSKARMLWRTKQNLDTIYIMNYGSKRADYYMHLEDDINSTARYARIIFDYIELKRDRPWFSMYFSVLGLIGKLFKSEDVKYFTYAIALYYKYKPVDWILYDVEHGRYCAPEYNKTTCNKALKKCRVMVAPPLFQHIGRVSSLQGKSQKLKERFYQKHNFKSNRGNPPAVITTTMKPYQRHTAKAGYENEGFMWFMDVRNGDYLRIDFDVPAKIVGILIISGVAPAPLDQFGPETEVYVTYSDGDHRMLGRFSRAGDFVAHLDGREVSALEIRVTDDKELWVIVGYFIIDVIDDQNQTLK